MEHCRLAEQTAEAARNHNVPLYLGHWDAAAATSRQDIIMQEERRGKLWVRGLIVTGGGLFTQRGMSGGCPDD